MIGLMLKIRYYKDNFYRKDDLKVKRREKELKRKNIISTPN